MLYDPAGREGQENCFAIGNGEHTFSLEKTTQYSSIRPGLDGSMSYACNIQHINSTVCQGGLSDMYMCSEQQELYESTPQDDCGTFIAPSIEYYTHHGSLPAHDPSQTSSQGIDSHDSSDNRASASVGSTYFDIGEVQAEAYRWKSENLDVDYMDMDCNDSVTEENPSESTDSVTPIEDDFSSMVHRVDPPYETPLFEGCNDPHLQHVGMVSDPSAFEMTIPAHKIDGNDLQWTFLSTTETRQTLSEEQVAQMLKGYAQPLEHTSVNSSNTPDRHTDVSAFSSHHQVNDADPATSISAFKQNVNTLLAHQQITMPPTHLLSLENSRPEEVFSGVGYPPGFQLFPRQPVEYHDADIRHESANVYSEVSNRSCHLNSHPSQTSIDSTVTSATNVQSKTSGLRCNILLLDGHRCDAYFKGKYAKSHRGRHIRLKHEGKVFVCENATCERVYTRRSYRSRHYIRHHPELARMQCRHPSAV